MNLDSVAGKSPHPYLMVYQIMCNVEIYLHGVGCDCNISDPRCLYLYSLDQCRTVKMINAFTEREKFSLFVKDKKNVPNLSTWLQ